MVVNFCGIRSKVADLAVSLDTYNPDVVIGTETHLDDSVHSQELFPQTFSVFRKDRNIGNSSRGES